MIGLPEAIIVALIAGVVSVLTTLPANWLQRRNERSKAVAEQTLPSKYDALRELHSGVVNCYDGFQRLSNTSQTTTEEWRRMLQQVRALSHTLLMAEIYLNLECQTSVGQLIVLFEQAIIKQGASIEQKKRAELLGLEAKSSEPRDLEAKSSELRDYVMDLVNAVQKTDAELKAEYAERVSAHKDQESPAKGQEEPLPKGVSPDLLALTPEIQGHAKSEPKIDTTSAVEESDDLSGVLEGFSWGRLRRAYERTSQCLQKLLNP